MISDQSLMIDKLQERLKWLVVVKVLSLIALVVTASTLVDKVNTYLIPFTYRVYMVIAFDVIFGVSIGFFFGTLQKLRLLKYFK